MDVLLSTNELLVIISQKYRKEMKVAFNVSGKRLDGYDSLISVNRANAN